MAFGKRTVALGTVAVLTVMGGIAVGCGGGIEIGPFELSLDLGSGAIDAGDFVKELQLQIPVSTTIEKDLCDLPTEAEIQTALQDIEGMDLSGVVSVSRVELDSTVVTATSGDFSSLTEIMVYFVPKPVGGVDQDAVFLGGVSAAGGLTSPLTLNAPESFDLLELIRDNDANPAVECPKVRFDVTGTPPAQAITYTVQLNVKVWVMLGG